MHVNTYFRSPGCKYGRRLRETVYKLSKVYVVMQFCWMVSAYRYAFHKLYFAFGSLLGIGSSS